MVFSPGRQVGRYQIQSVIGEGGMGIVYRAVDTQLGRIVALKVLSVNMDPQQQHRLEREARTASSLNHPNILTVYDIGDVDGSRYIATEFIEGMTLRKFLKQNKVSVADALEITAHICSALAAAHACGVIHRDVKPENIMIRNDGFLKVLDFGLAKFAQGKSSGQASTAFDTEPFTAVGTVLYMSPEQARALEIGAQTDIWSTGIVLYEMLDGDVPFRGETPVDSIVTAFTKPHAALHLFRTHSSNAIINDLISRAIAKDVKDRFASMNEFLEAIKDAQMRLAESEQISSNDIVKGAASLTLSSDSRISSEPVSLQPGEKRSNLPEQLTLLFGRESEFQSVLEILKSGNRLVTLTGPGGTGKTRLGLFVCQKLLPEFPDGVFLVPLESIRDPVLVPSEIAKALNVHEAAGILDSIKEALRGKQVLLFLDNFEHVIDAAPVLGELLRSSSGLKILVSSRESLRIQGEQEFAVPSLSYPEGPLPSNLEKLKQYSSIQLFLNRAKAVRPDFKLTTKNATAVARICARLQGLPLAIELAASRVRILPPHELLKKLEKRLSVLVGGPRDLPLRQQTMKNAIDWGYNLLSREEQMFFCKLCIFESSFTLEAARAVLREENEMQLLESLIDKNFLKQNLSAAEPRYSMLELIREYGLQQLQEQGLKEELSKRHATYFISVARQSEMEIASGKQESLGLLERDHDNLRAALAWTLESNNHEMALKLASSLWWFWYLHGHYTEGRKWLKSALASVDAANPDRSQALVGSGALAFFQCEYEEAEGLLNESLKLSLASNEKRTAAHALQFLGSVARERALYAEADARHRDSLDIWSELGDTRGVGRSLNYVSFAAWLQGNFSRAKIVCEQSIEIFQKMHDQEGIAWAWLNSAAVAYYENRIQDAEEHCNTSLISSRAVEYKEGFAWALNILGLNALRELQFPRAEKLLKRSLKFHWLLGDRWRIASVLEALGSAATDMKQYDRGITLIAAATALRKLIGTPVPPVEEPLVTRALESLRAATPHGFEPAWNAGLQVPLGRAVALALG